MFIKVPKGTQDILPEDISKWYYIEDVIKEILNKYGYKEIRTPFFEYTDLFVRGIGESTDIVTKEMFTFPDRKGRIICWGLRSVPRKIHCACTTTYAQINT